MNKIELATKDDIDHLQEEVNVINDELTQTEYDALPAAQKNNGTIYFVK